MNRPFAIGLCLSEHPLHSDDSTVHSTLPDHSPDDAFDWAKTPPTPDAVPVHPFVAHVAYHTSAPALSARFGLPESLISTEWLLHSPSASTSSQHGSPSLRSSLSGTARQSKRRVLKSSSSYRFTPRTVIDTHLFSHNNTANNTNNDNNNTSSSTSSTSPEQSTTQNINQHSSSSSDILAQQQPQQHNQYQYQPLFKRSRQQQQYVQQPPQHPQNSQQQQQQLPSNEMTAALDKCAAVHLDVVRFGSLFVAPDSAAAAAIRLGQDLCRRLRHYLETSGGDAAAAIPSVAKDEEEEHGQQPENGDLWVEKTNGSCVQCGMDRQKTHRHVDIACDGHAVYKVRPGLYRTARSIAPVFDFNITTPSTSATCTTCTAASGGDGGGMQRSQQCMYFEVAIVGDNEFSGNGNSDPCGVCVGVASASLPADRLIGSDDYSVGLHCSGSVVRQRGLFDAPIAEGAFGVGDRVGCAVCPCTYHTCSDNGEMGKTGNNVEVLFFVNNRLRTRAQLNVPPPATETETETESNDSDNNRRQLFAAVSLYKTGTKAVVLFRKEDWLADVSTLTEHTGGLRPAPICSS